MRPASLALTLLVLLPALARAEQGVGVTLLEPWPTIAARDFGEPLRDAIPLPPLYVAIGARGGIGGIDPATGLTRWKVERPGLRAWSVQGDDLLVEGDALDRLRLDGGAALWSIPLGCEGDACSLHVLAHDADTIWLGGIGPGPDQLMQVDARTGREMWPQWLPLGAPILRAVAGKRRLLVVLDDPEAGARVVALSPGSGLAAWKARPEDGRPLAADLEVSDLGDLACLSYPAEGILGARTLDLVDGQRGGVRLSRTVLDAPAGSLACLRGAPGTFRVASPGRIEALSLASLAPLAALPLPGTARATLRVEGATWLMMDAGLVRVPDRAPVPEPPIGGALATTCQAQAGRVTCPERVLLLPPDGAAPLSVARTTGELVVMHAGQVLGVSQAAFRVYRATPGTLPDTPRPVLTPRPGGL